MSRPRLRRYPLKPFVQLTGWSMKRMRRIAPCGGEEYQIRLADGVTEQIADRLAVAAGLDPYVIWPEMAEHVIADHQVECATPDCDVRFTPSRRGHRYHDKGCYQRWHKREQYRHRYATDPVFRAQEIEKSRVKRAATVKARKVKARAYYLRNADELRAKERARKAARRAAMRAQQEVAA